MKQPEAGTRNDLIEHRFCIAKEDLETAYLLLKAEQYRGANNRAYYSIYHTIDAVLSIEGLAFKRHKDTLAYFIKILLLNHRNSLGLAVFCKPVIIFHSIVIR